jgi:DNA-binding PadR family transcriptional regulator
MERYAGRLMILGMLSRGPMHGHRLRREAELRDVQDWAGIKPGSLYGMMHRLEDEGLIKPVRTEREGQRPARTVYAITEDGTMELSILLDKALQQVDIELGVFDVALLVADAMMGLEELTELVRLRMERTRSALDSLVAEQRRMEERSLPGRMERLIIKHAQLKFEAEMTWHEEILKSLEAASADKEVGKEASHQASQDDSDEPGQEAEPGAATPDSMRAPAR